VIGRVEVLEATVNSLEAQLEEQCSDADNAISQWQESVSALEAQNFELENQSRRRVTEIELTVKNLEAQLEERSIGFDNAIVQWEESYGALEDRNLKLEKQVETIMKNDELVRGAEAHVEAATEPQEISDLADFQVEISKLVGTDAAQLEQRIAALEGDLTSMTEQREKLASSLKERTSELNDQRTSYTESLSEKEAAKAQLGDGSANGAVPQGSVVAEMASLKSQLDEEREAHTSTQTQLLAIRKELEDFAVESEEIVDLWKGEYSLVSRIL
jgi:chromosome segregation ATPase